MGGIRTNGRQGAATAKQSLPLLLVVLTVAAANCVHAQAVPRTDTPRAGTFRVTFAPVITTWQREFTADGHEQLLGASLPAPIFVREERRVTPLAVEYGVTNRIALGVYVPIVRVNSRPFFQVDSTGKPVADSAVQHLDSLLQDTTYAFDPLIETERRLRYFAGDIELSGKYRFLETHSAALSAAVVLRLPTGHQDSPNNLFDIATGDHQTDIELQVAQEITLFDHLWLNGTIRAARQQRGTRARRIGPASTLLLPHASLAVLNWDPGDYVAVDFAPMLRLAEHFGVGFTAGYYTQQRDRYTYRSPQDSSDVANHLGTPISASVLDAGTAIRRTRLGVAMTYLGSAYEGSFSIEQTVTASGGLVPVATVFRIVMRTSRWPF
ncbi:MAG TPA: hypothetical protein VKQ05_00505 [Gemmatimonadales bacterium]|nr:hypothetical protein [Gemmatimonadales bacterium]